MHRTLTGYSKYFLKTIKDEDYLISDLVIEFLKEDTENYLKLKDKLSLYVNNDRNSGLYMKLSKEHHHIHYDFHYTGSVEELKTIVNRLAKDI